MKRVYALALLLAVSIAAGALLPGTQRPAPPPPAPEPCGTGEECSVEAGAAAGAPASPGPEAQTAPAVRDSTEPSPSAPTAAMQGDALREEADRLLAEGRVREAIERMRKAAEVDPSARNHGDLGHLLQRLTAFDEALVHLRRAAELDPGNADRWIALANAYYRAVDPGEAWKAEKKAKEAEPGLELGRDRYGMRVRKGDSAPRIP